MRFVFDTNVIISALLFEESTPAKALIHGFKKGEVLFSSDTSQELEQILSQEKFDPYITLEERTLFISIFLKRAVPIEITETFSVCRDPKDNKILELAVSGHANFIITGDCPCQTLL